jgi:hypothetical protein
VRIVQQKDMGQMLIFYFSTARQMTIVGTSYTVILMINFFKGLNAKILMENSGMMLI